MTKSRFVYMHQASRATRVRGPLLCEEPRLLNMRCDGSSPGVSCSAEGGTRVRPGTVTLHYRGAALAVSPGKLLADCLAEAGLGERRLLAPRNGGLVAETELLCAGDEVQLLDRISGGGE